MPEASNIVDRARLVAQTAYHRYLRIPVIDTLTSVLQHMPLQSEWFGPPKGLAKSRSWVETWNSSAPGPPAQIRSVQSDVLSPLITPLGPDGSQRFFDLFGMCPDIPEVVSDRDGRNSVRHSELFVAEVPNGRIYTGDGYVITPDDLVLADLSPDYVAQRYIKRKHSALASIRLPKLHRLPGATACLATPFAGEFFGHWIMDLVPRIGLLTSAGYKLADIDWFYLPGKLHSYQAEILARLDIGREKIIESDVYPHVKVDRLLAPSAVFGTFAASRFVCDYLVDAFGGMNAPAGAASKKIYVSRRNTSHRRVVNEPEVMAFLSARGYVSVEPQGMSMQEQQDLFRSADVVVMPLGSALVHTVFCRPGTKVIELLNPRCVQICTLSICTQQRLEYYYLLCNGVDPLQHVIQEDIVVDMARLADVMAMAGA